jgi:aryl-alcohol dehydrogenase-like predicted oxidoreductase
MEYRRLGSSGLTVSDLCMGTMTFGLACDEPLSFQIMDRAFDAGIDFYDTAEVYPVPPRADLVGVTEEIVGRWMRTKSRDAVTIATKVTGLSENILESSSCVLALLTFSTLNAMSLLHGLIRATVMTL